MQLLIATTNANKVREILPVLQRGLREPHVPRDRPADFSRSEPLQFPTLADFSAAVDPPEETGTTYWENARQKAFFYARDTGLIAVAEDSGLEIAALDGEPGVHSARFLGPEVPYADRFAEIYRRLKDVPAADRQARFVTALTVAGPDGGVLFETQAVIEGVVAAAPTGTHGFGYDPIFFYAPLGKTTAELTLDEKCAVSHRARAFRDLARWLRVATA
jgi:XTP/dITP diphosphohydrolase